MFVSWAISITGAASFFSSVNQMQFGRVTVMLLATILLQAAAAWSLSAPIADAGDNGSMPYLLLVWRGMNSFEQQEMELLEESAYDGIALKPFSAKFYGPVPSLEDFKPLLSELGALKANSTKDLWPAVYLNRMVGYSPFEPPGSSEYFKGINGIDLDNETGARADFEEIFALSLRMARELDSPGIVVDLEAYNSGGGSGVNPVYHMEDLVYIRGESEEVIVGKLQDLGHSLADLAAEIYPGCTIMLLFTHHDWTVAEIVIGMLDKTQELDSGVHLIDGGEVGIGYTSEDVDDLESKIMLREEVWSEKFPYPPDLFSLGGTICPYLNRSRASDFLQGNGEHIRTLEDFEPLFHALFDAFDLIWIYSGGADYNPYDPQDATSFNFVFEVIIDNYERYGKKSPKLVENLVQELRVAISEAGEVGVDTEAYNRSIRDILSLTELDRYPEAYDLVTNAISGVNKECETAKRIHAEDVIEEAERRIELAREEGMDTSRCEPCIEAARKALERGHYQSAESLCSCALNLQIPEMTLFTLAAYLILLAVTRESPVHQRAP